MGTWALAMVATSCAAPGAEWEPAGPGASLLPPDRSIEQVFGTEDEAAKAACAWLWNNEPKAGTYEYCGYILRTEGGYRATIPMTKHKQNQCPRPTPGPPEATGWYHSHVKTTEFSPPDKSHEVAIALYLCAANRMVKKLTPEGTVTLK